MSFDKTVFEKELLGDTVSNLKYWETVSLDPGKGIFLTLGCDNLPLASGVRSTVLISRILWAYSTAYRLMGNPRYLELADIAFRDFRDHYVDRASGGVFEKLNADGTPLDTRKITYTQSYAVYGLAEYALASGSVEAANLATEISGYIDSRAYSEEYRCYLPAFDRQWNNLGGTVSIDVHMHLVESYTTLYKLTRSAALGERLKYIVRLLIDHYLRPNGALYQQLHTDMSETDDLSDRFGDDAECCWMIAEAAAALEDSSFASQVSPASIRLAQHILEDGIDRTYGGVYDRRNTDGSMNTEKMWWEESESVIAMMYAYRLTGNEQYAEAAWNIWKFIQSYIATDREWNWRVKADGTPIPAADPSDPLKCPYHNTRLTALVVPILRGMQAHTPNEVIES